MKLVVVDVDAKREEISILAIEEALHRNGDRPFVMSAGKSLAVFIPTSMCGQFSLQGKVKVCGYVLWEYWGHSRIRIVPGLDGPQFVTGGPDELLHYRVVVTNVESALIAYYDLSVALIALDELATYVTTVL